MKTIILLLTATACFAQSSFRVATGNPAPYTDSFGDTWVADLGTDCQGGVTYSSAATILGTADPTLYQYGRLGNVGCHASLAVGVYTITLKFADTQGILYPGQQIFNIFVNGTLQKSNFDLFGTVRVINTAYDVVLPPFANLGTGLTVSVVQVVGTAQLQAVSMVANAVVAGVPSVNGITSAVTVAAGAGVDVNKVGATLTVSNTGVRSINLLTGTPVIAAGTGTAVTPGGGLIVIDNTGVVTSNGADGVVVNKSGTTTTTSLLEYASYYNFPAITPTGSPAIVPGPVTLTIPLAPLGLSATNYYMYISAGVGTPEAVLISGGSCTPGATNCTISFTAANNHSGAYTLTSASGGVQECVNARPYRGCHVGVGTYNVYATIYAGSPIMLKGDGRFNTTLEAQAAGLGILDLDASHSLVEDMGFKVVSQGTAGNYGIRVGQSGEASFNDINRVYFEPIYDPILMVNASHLRVSNCVFYNFTHIGISVADAAGLDNLGLQATNNVMLNFALGAAATAGISITSTSAIITANWIGGTDVNQLSYGIKMVTGVATAGGLAITGNQIQTCATAMIDLSGFNTLINITGNQLADGGLAGKGINIVDSGGQHISRGSIIGNVFQGPGVGTAWTGVYFSGGATEWVIAGNSFSQAQKAIELAGSGAIDVGANSFINVTAPITKSSTGTTWTDAILENSWTNAGAPYSNAKYKITGDRVYLAGLVQGGTEVADTVITTLPAGFRPVKDMLTIAWGGANATAVPVPVAIRINANGAVAIEGNSLAASGFVSLEGISFSTI